MRNLTASDRSALIKLASSLPAGSPERKAILAGLQGSSNKTATRDLSEYDFTGFGVYMENPEELAKLIGSRVLKPFYKSNMDNQGPQEIKDFMKEVARKLEAIIRECNEYTDSLKKEYSIMLGLRAKDVSDSYKK